LTGLSRFLHEYFQIYALNPTWPVPTSGLVAFQGAPIEVYSYALRRGSANLSIDQGQGYILNKFRLLFGGD
jgi:hypothetical protein